METLLSPQKPLRATKKTRTSMHTKNAYEKQAWQVKNVVCGIDEVGRGCLAGPVVTAAVILPSGKTHPLLKDSKTMSEAERNAAFLWIQKHCWYAIGIVHHRAIDKHNIWNATLQAMHKAVMHVMAISPHSPTMFLVDAMPLKLTGSAYEHIPIHSFIKGEQRSSSIAAASIVAKVWRDNLISSMAKIFPGYALEDHKGYATKKHTDALSVKKQSLIHRTTFLKDTYRTKEYHETHQSNRKAPGFQQTIC